MPEENKSPCATLSYHGPSCLAANQIFEAELRIVLHCPIHTGGRFVLAARHFSDLGRYQLDDPRGENYVSLRCSNPEAQWERWRGDPYEPMWRHPWNSGIELKLSAGELAPGDTISVMLGDRAGGSPGFRCQSLAETRFHFRLGIDPAGDAKWQVLPDGECPGAQVVGNIAKELRIIVPRMTSRGGRIVCHIKPEDPYGNVAGSGDLDVALSIDGVTVLERVHVGPGRVALAELPAPVDERWRRISATTDDGAYAALSNPFGPSPTEGYHLYWGEIHGQSGLCDGTNSPAEIYTYAREAAGLDFASVTSHDFELTAENWEEIRQATREAHQPGEFVTFLGYEWSGDTKRGGDNNIYFLDDDGPLVYSAPYSAYPAWDSAEGQVRGSRTLTETIAQLQGRPFMVVPHCGGRRCNFDFYDARVMPMFEMHSCHRNYEHVAREAMARGLRFGFIGGSDDHRGALGDSHLLARDWAFSTHNGLVAVYAKELTRESLWEAFFAKRVYATNGPRIVLAASIDGTSMGGSLSVAAGTKMTLSMSMALDGYLDRVEVVRDADVVETIVPVPFNQVPEFRKELGIVSEAGTHAYYVRVFQADGGRAWSTPIWVDGQ